MMVPAMLRANPSPTTLAPVYEREIIFRVLQGPHGWMLRDIVAPDTAMARINLAIQWIRRDFAEPIGVERLALCASMSVSGFHRYFKAVTNLTPCAVPEAGSSASGQNPKAS